MAKYTDGNGKAIQIGKELGKGGEASVFAIVGNDNLVAKIYNNTHLIDKQKLKKLQIMCKLYDNDIREYYAWPQKIIYSNGEPVGFIMENLNSPSKNFNGSEYKKFVNFYVWKDRRKFFSNIEYKFMVHSAQNLAKAVGTLHEKGIVIGDINESNVFVNDTDATIKLIDCDSYQIEDYLCDVGKPEYTAPELPDKLRGERRTTNHDYFALAIMIFLILVGKHPYTGLGTTLDQIRQSIIQGLYCYGRNAKKKNISALYPYSEVYDYLNDELKELFEQAFTTLNRPTTQQWVLALEKYEKQLVECQNDEGHFYNPEYNTCIWCELEKNNYYAFGNASVKTNQIKNNYNTQTTYQSNLKPQNIQTKSNYSPQSYSNYNITSSRLYQQPTNVNWDWLKYLILLLVVIFIAYIFSTTSTETKKTAPKSTSSSQVKKQTKEAVSSSSKTSNNWDSNISYPKCDADSTLKPMKSERTEKYKNIFANSPYMLNANYSLWYRNIIDNNGNCEAEELIKNLYWADANVYMGCPISYNVSYDSNNNTQIQYSLTNNFYDLINNCYFYNSNGKMSNEQVNSLLEESLEDSGY